MRCCPRDSELLLVVSCLPIGERVGERLAERVAERIGERAAERAGEGAAARLEPASTELQPAVPTTHHPTPDAEVDGRLC